MNWFDLSRIRQFFTREELIEPQGVALPAAILTPEEELGSFVDRLSLEATLGEGINLYHHPSGIRVLSSDLDKLQLGGKSVGLMTLARLELPIPPTLMISADLYGEEVPVVANMNEVYRNSRHMFTRLSPAILKGCKAAGITSLTMVRSSGSEDLAQHTAAGVFLSLAEDLRRDPNEVAQTVQTVALSAYPETAAKFCRDRGTKIAPIPCLINGLIYDSTSNLGAVAPYLSMTIDSSDPEVITAAITPGLGATIASGRANCLIRYQKATGEYSMRGSSYGINKVAIDPALSRRPEIIFERPALIEWIHGPMPFLPKPEEMKAVLDRVAADIKRMEPNGFGLDIELAIRSHKDLNLGKVVYLQRRVLPQLESAFRLPFVHTDRVLAQSSTAIGQGVIASKDVVELRIPSWRDEDPIDQLRQSLAEMELAIGDRCPEGFIYVVDFDSSHIFLNRPEAFQDVIRQSFRGAKAILVRDNEINFDHLDSSVVMSHFSHFFRSEGIPIFFGSIHQLGKAYRDYLDSPGGSFVEFGELARHYHLPSPLIVACDQRTGIGIVAKGG